MSSRFWETTSLVDMTTQQWESLCDGCGRCCLNKFEDEDNGRIYFTNVSCQLFDADRCRCSDYEHRAEKVPDCMLLSVDRLDILSVMPDTCAYKLLAIGEALPGWHPLVSGDPDSVRQAGMSVAGSVVSEEYIHPQQMVEHIIDWITADIRLEE